MNENDDAVYPGQRRQTCSKKRPGGPGEERQLEHKAKDTGDPNWRLARPAWIVGDSERATNDGGAAGAGGAGQGAGRDPGHAR